MLPAGNIPKGLLNNPVFVKKLFYHRYLLAAELVKNSSVFEASRPEFRPSWSGFLQISSGKCLIFNYLYERPDGPGFLCGITCCNVGTPANPGKMVKMAPCVIEQLVFVVTRFF